MFIALDTIKKVKQRPPQCPNSPFRVQNQKGRTSAALTGCKFVRNEIPPPARAD
jgi:hypothetical protein